MAFPFTPEQQSVRDAIATLCARFDDDYWLVQDRDGGWPTDFHKAVAEAGWRRLLSAALARVRLGNEHGAGGTAPSGAAEVELI